MWRSLDDRTDAGRRRSPSAVRPERFGADPREPGLHTESSRTESGAVFLTG